MIQNLSIILFRDLISELIYALFCDLISVLV